MRGVLLLLLTSVPGWSQGVASLAILQKGASSLGFYTAEGKHIVSVPVGRHPHEMVSDGRYIYTTDNGTMRIEQAGTGGNTVSIIDIAARKKVGEISTGNFRRPHGIDLDRKTGRLLVSCELPDQLLVIDPVKRSVVRSYDTQGKTSHMVSARPDTGWAYVSNSTSHNVAAIELASGRVTLIPTGARPEGSVFSGDGKLLYVANREGASITIIDTEKQQFAGSIATGKGPVRIARTPDSRVLVYALIHDKAVEFADPQSRKVIGRVALGGELVSMSVSADGKLAFASAQYDDIVYVVSIPQRKLVREIRTGRGMGPDPVMSLK